VFFGFWLLPFLINVQVASAQTLATGPIVSNTYGANVTLLNTELAPTFLVPSFTVSLGGAGNTSSSEMSFFTLRYACSSRASRNSRRACWHKGASIFCVLIYSRGNAIFFLTSG
jgi:hypothetical protein